MLNSLTVRTVFYLTLLVYFPNITYGDTADNEVCLNFYILTKTNKNSSEQRDFDAQKTLALKQMTQAQRVFEHNKERYCPIIKFSKGRIKHIDWQEASNLSRPVDKNITENMEQYLVRKLEEASVEIEIILTKINDKPNMRYLYFKDLRSGRAIYIAEAALQNINVYREKSNNKNTIDTKNLEENTKISITKLRHIIDAYDKEDSVELVNAAKRIVRKHEEIDKLSAISWSEGKLILWNDIEAQNTSVELKNLLRTYRTAENQCLDVYIVPEVKSPSTTVKENKKSGKWTRRDGAAFSSKLFPRATSGKGHAIVLTYDSKPSEYRLAHEFAHLLLEKKNAHLNKKETDLMHEFSLGGAYLNEEECEIIKYNIKTFFGGNVTVK